MQPCRGFTFASRGARIVRDGAASSRMTRHESFVTTAATAQPASSMTTTTTTVTTAATDKVSQLGTLHLDNIHNLRDLAEACPRIQPGRVLRCAKPSEASEADVGALLQGAGIRDLIDLRSSEELAEDPPASHLFAQATLRRYTRHWLSGKVMAEPGSSHMAPVVHHNVSMLERYRYYYSLLFHVPATSLAQAIALRFIDAEWSRLVLLKHVNAGGLALLYQILVDSAAPEIGTVLRLVLSALEAERPVLVFCKAGKDRTGIISTLVLACAGATAEEIINDYTRSDAFHAVALAGIENKPELKGLDRAAFERAPESAIRALLDHLRQRYGGAAEYMEHACGFSREHQARLRTLLTARLK